MIGLGSYLFLNCTMYIIKDFFFEETLEFEKKKKHIEGVKKSVTF